jgi:transposase-like protein
VVQEAYVNGVSTRKVDRVVEQIGVRMTKDQVSRLCRRLDEQVGAFRERPLEGAYPYLWLDARQEKVRDGAHVVSKAVVIGVHETGRREVIGPHVGEIESEAFWREFFAHLSAAASTAFTSASSMRTRASNTRSPACSAACGSAARPLRSRHAPALPAESARARVGSAQGGLQRRRLRAGA